MLPQNSKHKQEGAYYACNMKNIIFCSYTICRFFLIKRWRFWWSRYHSDDIFSSVKENSVTNQRCRTYPCVLSSTGRHIALQSLSSHRCTDHRIPPQISRFTFSWKCTSACFKHMTYIPLIWRLCWAFKKWSNMPEALELQTSMVQRKQEAWKCRENYMKLQTLILNFSPKKGF